MDWFRVSGPMPIVRFVREGIDVDCYPGENLREVALREGVQLYGLKGQLGNCGGCGQCITCFVSVEGGLGDEPLTPLTPVEEVKLEKRPKHWRLACQAMVQSSLIVLTRPQASLDSAEARLKDARETALPQGTMAWPEPEESLDEGDDMPEEVVFAAKPDDRA